jgi:hypothetical protein
MMCTTPLLYILAPTFFDSSLPSSGSFWDPSELLEILRLLPSRIFYHSIFVVINFPLLSSPTLCYRILKFTFLPPCKCSSYYTFLPHFNSYILFLLCHSVCFILHKMLYTLIILSLIHFRYTTHSICVKNISEGSTKIPDDGRLLSKHVGASI